MGHSDTIQRVQTQRVQQRTIQQVLDEYTAYTTDQPVDAPVKGMLLRTIRKHEPETTVPGKRRAEKQMLAKAMSDAVVMRRRLLELRMQWNDAHELYGHARYSGEFPQSVKESTQV